MKVIPTQLIVEECIIEVNKQEMGIIKRALYEHRIMLLNQQENLEKIKTRNSKDELIRIQIKLTEIECLEEVIDSYFRIPLFTKTNEE